MTSDPNAELIRAARYNLELPPDWLKVTAIVYSSHHGAGVVEAWLGSRIYVLFGTQRVSYPDWQRVVAQALLSPGSGSSPPTEAMDPRFQGFVGQYQDQIAHLTTTPAQTARAQDLPEDLPLALSQALRTVGIDQLYSHQVEALQSLRQGQDVMLCSPTASGKTLCFNPAIFESCLNDPTPTALYLYPLKALLYDQIGKLHELNTALPPDLQFKIGALTGDTDRAERQTLFQGSVPRILALNPDILHYQLYRLRDLRAWEQWRTFLKQLRWVVLDEAHTYLGNFGAHVANVLRRLTLAVDTLGGDSRQIQFILSSATVGNPRSMALRLMGREHEPERLHLIDQSGAKVGARTYLHLRPTNSANPEAAKVVIDWLRLGISGLVFCNSRQAAKSLLNLVRRRLGREGGHTRQVSLFYGSVKPEQRREITEGLRSGAIKIVITTSALEAGIDLPSVDAVLLRGFPGSLMSYRQRAGRCGRSGPGLVVFLPLARNPLDSYYAQNPQALLQAPAEQVAFNAHYPSLVRGHMKCACCESGLSIDQVERRFGRVGGVAAQQLLARREVQEQGNRLTAGGFPHREVSLRGDQQEFFRLMDQGELVEELNPGFTYAEAHPEALYLCLDDQQDEAYYRVLSLDLERRQVALERLTHDPGYRTRAIQAVEIEVLEDLGQPQVVATTILEGRARLTLSWGRITTLVVGYEIEEMRQSRVCVEETCQNYRRVLQEAQCPRCQRSTQERNTRTTVETVEFPEPYRLAFEAPVLSLELNPVLQRALDHHAQQVWQELVKAGQENPWEGNPTWVTLHTWEHLLTQAIPLLVIAGAQDLGGVTFGQHPQRIGITTFFYDTSPGGTGVAEVLFDRFGEFVDKALGLAQQCACSQGCPTCLFRQGCAHWNLGLVKALGLYLGQLFKG